MSPVVAPVLAASRDAGGEFTPQISLRQYLGCLAGSTGLDTDAKFIKQVERPLAHAARNDGQHPLLMQPARPAQPPEEKTGQMPGTLGIVWSGI